MMTATRTAEHWASIAKGLAHPARLRIVADLAAHPRTVGELASGCPLAQSTVSEHLRILRTAGVVTAHRDGRRTCYHLDSAVLRDLAAWLEGVGA